MMDARRWKMTLHANGERTVAYVNDAGTLVPATLDMARSALDAVGEIAEATWVAVDDGVEHVWVEHRGVTAELEQAVADGAAELERQLPGAVLTVVKARAPWLPAVVAAVLVTVDLVLRALGH